MSIRDEYAIFTYLFPMQVAQEAEWPLGNWRPELGSRDSNGTISFE